MSRRIDRDLALRLLASTGKVVHLREHALLEDVNGDPLGVHVETSTGLFYVTPALLGWTWDELGLTDPGADA